MNVPPGAREHRLPDGRRDLLIREEPLLIEVSGQSVLTMRTPDGTDRELAVGFLMSEGVLPDVAGVQGFDEVPEDGNEPDRIVVQLDGRMSGEVRGRLTRTHEIRSSCGVCGLGDPEALAEALPPTLPGVPRIALSQVAELVERNQKTQPLFAATGASHGAGLFTHGGEALGSGEDVGRHNALDKAIGRSVLAGHGEHLPTAVAVLSGRAGYDLAVKCLRMQIPVIVSVSAPSAQAVALCEASGATLIGFARGDRQVVYTDGSGRLESS